MHKFYEVRSGQRAVSLQGASSAHEALVEYLRSLGCSRDEIMTMGTDAVAWRGATYRAVPSEDDALGRHAA